MATAPPTPQMAELQVEGGEPIKCLFNPTEYTITKTNQWDFKTGPGKSLPPGQFKGGNPRELSVSLLFDKSLLGPGQTIKDVTDELFKMMEVRPGKKPGGADAVPPAVTFKWGAVDTFKAVCTSLTVAFQLFQPNGDPIRADVKLQLKQLIVASTKSSGGANKKTNPTTRAQTGIGVHTVRDGDSLPSIAFANYGDATHWRPIAEANGIDDPLRLRRGAALTIPAPDAL